MLPYTNRNPPLRLQDFDGTLVAKLVGENLLVPEFAVTLRSRPMDWTAVPEAAIDKNRNFRVSYDEIGYESMVVEYLHICFECNRSLSHG